MHFAFAHGNVEPRSLHVTGLEGIYGEEKEEDKRKGKREREKIIGEWVREFITGEGEEVEVEVDEDVEVDVKVGKMWREKKYQ